MLTKSILSDIINNVRRTYLLNTKRVTFKYSHPTSRVARLAGKDIQKVKTGLALKNVGSTPTPPISTIVLQSKKRKEVRSMARTPMVTRTITATKAIVMCVDVEAGEPFNKEVTVPRTYKDTESLLKTVKPIIETGSIKAVHIVDKTEIETLYGMTEQDFIEHATVLPKRVAKPEKGAE